MAGAFGLRPTGELYLVCELIITVKLVMDLLEAYHQILTDFRILDSGERILSNNICSNSLPKANNAKNKDL